MTTIHLASKTTCVLIAGLLLASGVANAGTSTTSMRVGLTLVAPGTLHAATRVDGAINAEGAMSVSDASRAKLVAAVDSAPRSERVLGVVQPDGSRIVAVQF